MLIHGVSIKFINNSKLILKTSGEGNLKNTIYDLFGKEIYDNVIPIDYQIGSMKSIGMIGTPKISRSTRMHQFCFINSRYVKDKIINSAIEKACQEKYAINKHAFLVINLEILPSFIDVNVHPAKLEVKFEDESKIFDLVYYSIRSAIEKENKKESPFSTIAGVNNEEKIEQISLDVENNYISNNIPKSKIFDFNILENSKNEYEIKENEQKEEFIPNTQIDNKTQDYFLNDDIKVKKSTNTQEIVSNIQSSQTEISEVKEVSYKYIGQVFDTYIIIQIKEKMYIIDQHAAHERLLYEKIKEAYYSKDRQSQLLLIPSLIEFTSKEMSAVLENMEMFEKSGFTLEEFDLKTIKISGVPNIGYDIDYVSMFKDIVDELLGANKTEKTEKEFKFIATLACKAAVKGNMNLSSQEQINLIDNMVKLDNPFTCPHGRPTAYEISKYEIERKFLRK
ncbi:MAG: DNA mismatch repair endonuclease MutL [Clostridia bacterium]